MASESIAHEAEGRMGYWLFVCFFPTFSFFDIITLCKLLRSLLLFLQQPPGGGGGGETRHMKGVGMRVVSLRGVNFGFWSHLGCSG